MKTKADVIETMKASIAAQIAGDRKHGWGQKDSMNVIEDLLAEYGASFASAEEGDVEIAKAVLQGINQVVNPSACHQWLQSDACKLLDKQEGKRAKADRLFASFTS